MTEASDTLRATGKRRLDEFIQVRPGNLDDFLAQFPEYKGIKEELQDHLDAMAAAHEFRLVESTDTKGNTRIAYAPAEPEVGIRFKLPSKFKALKHLGKGANGEVWEVYHKHLQEKQVVKILAWQEDDSDRLRFQRETIIMAKEIDHSNVMEVIDSDVTEDGYSYFTMPYSEDARTLEEILRVCPKLSTRRAVEIALQAASGLEAVHKANLIHRDVKPSNLLVVRDKERGELVKVFDFGIAARFTSGAENKEPSEFDVPPITKQGQIIGTPEYMAPERFVGLNKNPTIDIYGLGATLYEMLVGYPPFDYPGARDGGDDRWLRISRESANTQVEFPKEFRAAIPSRLRAAVLKSLEIDPKNRFDSMKRFRGELEKVLADLPKESDPHDRTTLLDLPGLAHGKDSAPTKETKSSRTVAVIAGLLIPALGAGVYWWTTLDPEPQKKEKTTGFSEAPIKTPPPTPPKDEKEPPKDNPKTTENPKPPESPPRPTLAELLKEAERVYMEGDYKRALTLVKKLLEENPGFIDGRELRAKILMKIDPVANAQAALDDLDAVIKGKGGNDDLFRLVSLCHYNLHHPDKARETIRKVTGKGEDDGSFDAKCSIRMLEPEAAISTLQDLPSIAPSIKTLAIAEFELSKLTVAESPSDLSQLVKSIGNLRALGSSLSPEDPLRGSVLYFEASGLARFGLAEQAVELIKAAKLKDPSIVKSVDTSPLDLQAVSKAVWADLEKDNPAPAKDFGSIAEVLPAPMKTALIDPLTAELAVFEAYQKRDYAQVFKAYSGQSIPARRNLILEKSAARTYASIKFTPISVNLDKWNKPFFNPDGREPYPNVTIPNDNSFELETDSRECRFVTKEAIASMGYEISITPELPHDASIAYVDLTIRPDLKAVDRGVYVRVTTREVQLIERAAAADNFHYKIASEKGMTITVTIVSAGEVFPVYLNGKLVYILSKDQLTFPGAIGVGAIDAKVKASDIRLVR